MLKDGKLQLSWSRFYEQCKADIRLWCYFVLFQQMCRLYFICILAHHLAPETRFSTILYAMLHGLRFDSLWATCWLFISLAFLTIPSLFIARMSYGLKQKYRQYLGGIFTVVTTIIYIASVEYFREYKNIFNQFLFGWFYDDKIAILKTIYADHHVIPNFILLVMVLLLYAKYSGYFIHNPQRTQSSGYSTRYKITLSIVIVLFYVVGFRGSIGHRPIQLKDAGVTTDAFLNKAIVSPYSSLKYAIDDYQDLKQSCQEDANLSAHDVQAIAKKFFDIEQQYSTLAKYMEKTTQGSIFPRPKHIFIIVGESLDAWPLQDKYRQLNLTPNLHEIAANGIYFKYFLSCTYGTMETLNTIMTGIPDAGLRVNYQKRASSPYPTTLATQFKKLGFKTQFFYGGYLSWQRVGDFASSQDFAAVYGAAHIKNWQQTNEWGVDDRTLFEFVANTIRGEKTPTFNVIMTTSNHPPFSINLEQEGFPKEKIQELLSQYSPTNTNVKELGHIWYADKTIGEFVKKIIAIDKTALFAITGDHYGRRHILPNPPSFDATAVPLIIYSAKIKEYCDLHHCQTADLTAGSHLDLAATLIELVAPKCFTYYSLGDNLLAKRKFNLGIGKDKIITPDFIAAVYSADIMYFKKSEYSVKYIDALKARFKQATYIARYLIQNGGVLDATDQTHEASKS
ncbi:MAG: Sulfatase [uncultured bacterium]|nr:MAG: Sulfatase [uncultured bacterium]